MRITTGFNRLLTRLTAVAAGLVVPGIAASQVFDGGGVLAGVNAAGCGGIVSCGDLAATIDTIVNNIASFLGIAALVAITVAGLYLLLGFGDDGSRDRAKSIIFNTAIGMAVIIFAVEIKDFVLYILGSGGSASIVGTVEAAVDRIVEFIFIMATVAIVVAGLYLILGFGDEGSKDKAKNIILYAAIGIGVIILAQDVIDMTLYVLGEGGDADIVNTLANIVSRFADFLILFATIAIVVAGLYLVLGFGNDGNKDKAKNIIIYTAIGIVIAVLAEDIVNFILFLLDAGGADNLSDNVQLIIERITSFLALLATIAVIIAGLYLVLGLGSDSSREKAKNIVLYTIIGIILIALAGSIVSLIFYFTGEGDAGDATEVKNTIINIIETVLSYLALVAVIVIIIAGIRLIVGMGSDESRDTAKKTILYALIGLIIVLLSVAIVQLTISVVQ